MCEYGMEPVCVECSARHDRFYLLRLLDARASSLTVFGLCSLLLAACLLAGAHVLDLLFGLGYAGGVPFEFGALWLIHAIHMTFFPTPPAPPSHPLSSQP